MTENSLLSCLCIISQCVYSAHTRHWPWGRGHSIWSI
jgi:hypothetical protein